MTNLWKKVEKEKTQQTSQKMKKPNGKKSQTSANKSQTSEKSRSHKFVKKVTKRCLLVRKSDKLVKTDTK